MEQSATNFQVHISIFVSGFVISYIMFV